MKKMRKWIVLLVGKQKRSGNVAERDKIERGKEK